MSTITYPQSYIIPVMGPTGAGKSTFINQLLGRDKVKVGHSLTSCTINLEPVNIPEDRIESRLEQWNATLREKDRKLIIVDTPGFDDTSADDSEILRRIGDWLVHTHGADAKLAGVIYLQDICQRRVTGATKRNFEVFDKLCGERACESVVLGTTQWKRVPDTDYAMATQREEELKIRFWNVMIGHGSQVQRVDDERRPEESPWDLVETVLTRGAHTRTKLKLQEELAELKMRLPETQAAGVLRERIEELIKSMKKVGATKAELKKLENEVKALKKSLLARFFSHFIR